MFKTSKFIYGEINIFIIYIICFKYSIVLEKMNPIDIAIIVIVFVAIIIIGITLFIVYKNKPKHNSKIAQQFNALRVNPKPFRPNQNKKTNISGGDENDKSDEYVTDLYNKYKKFYDKQMKIDLNDETTDKKHKYELMKQNYNNVLNYVIRTKYTNEGDDFDPLERLAIKIKELGLFILNSPSYDDVDDYNYEFFGYDVRKLPEVHVLYADLEDDKQSPIDDNKNLNVEIILEVQEDARVLYKIDFSNNDEEQYYMQKTIKSFAVLPIYVANQSNVLKVLTLFNDIWTGKIREGE